MKYQVRSHHAAFMAALLAGMLVLLTGCVPTIANKGPAGALSATSAAASATPTVQPTTAAAASEPAAATEAATAAPSASAQSGLTRDDYYIVERNQRAGVVDRNGKVVLPFEFGSISVVDDYRLQYALPSAQSKPLPPMFLCRPYALHPAGKPEDDSMADNPVAKLYDVNGNVVGDGTYLYGYLLDDNLIALCKTNDDKGTGVIDGTGRQVVPFQYGQVELLGAYIVGCDSVNRKLDFYTTEGVLAKTVNVDVNSIGAQSGYLVVYKGSFAALLDSSLQWMFPNKNYQSIRVLDKDHILVSDGSVNTLMDATGKDLLGKPYQSIEAVTANDGSTTGYVCASEVLQTVAAYDAAGKLLFEKQGCTNLRATAGPYYIADQAGVSRFLDAKGNEILSGVQGNASNWLADGGYFEFYGTTGGGSIFARADGSTVQLPTGTGDMYLGGDRFMVSVDETHCGICDGKGNWIVQPVYPAIYMLNGEDKLLTAMGADGLVGILDYNGNWVIPPVFDSLYGRGNGLLNAQKGSRSGLLDWSGHWVWSTSDYEELVD